MNNRFDWVVRGEVIGPDARSDIDLSTDKHFALVPSLGSIVPGWLLAIPRKPMLSLRQLSAPERIDFLEFCGRRAGKLSRFASRTYYLEHGPSTEKSAVGCGVDHAHMHLLPTELPLMDAVLEDTSVAWMEVDNRDPWASLPSEREYYLISNLQKSYVGFPRESRSQYFRVKLAALNGTPNQWDYRTWPHYEHVKRTIDGFASEPVWKAA